MDLSSMFLLIIYLTLLVHLFPSNANLHKVNNFLKSSPAITDPQLETQPTRFFEVTKPIKTLPNTKPCTHQILQNQDFAYTYGKPPVLANYTPPLHCTSQDFSTIVLEWNATCKGRQFDRIFGVWLGGVELLRSCTAEPTRTGIVWTVQKDITRYHSLLLKNESQKLSVFLGNIVDSTYTGVYHVNLTVYFYYDEGKLSDDLGDSGTVDGYRADLILPISRNLPLNDGLWFEIENSTEIMVKEFVIPQNVYRAVLEVYVSFHENDEFWYSNLPNDYIAANNLTGTPGNGAFREVVVSLDGDVIGAVWPFTVIYTGGVNPLLWRPITGIGSFDLPSYDIEITPLLENLLDGKTHEFGFSVTNALNVWYIDANLHLWLDQNSAKTEAKLLRHISEPLDFSLLSDFKGLNGVFLTTAYRSLSSEGWVISSYGKIITCFTQQFTFRNFMEMGKDGNLQIVNQTTYFDNEIYLSYPSSYNLSLGSVKYFEIDFYSDFIDQGNDCAFYVTNVTLGFYGDSSKDADLGFSISSLKNLQNAQGVMVVKNNLVVSGVGSTQQVYDYNGGDLCYFRNISSSNYTILYDTVGITYKEREWLRFISKLGRWLLFQLKRLLFSYY